MDTVEFLRDRKVISEDSDKLTIKNDEGEFSLNELLEDWSKEKSNSYMRLAADFDNFKKRVSKEKEDLVSNTKIKMLTSILDMDNDISIAMKNLSDDSKEGMELIASKLTKFLSSHGIEEIQTDEYDSELHEVISLVDVGEAKVVDVISKGYTLNGLPFRYPKIVMGK